jgi:hypothetical protein
MPTTLVKKSCQKAATPIIQARERDGSINEATVSDRATLGGLTQFPSGPRFGSPKLLNTKVIAELL